MPWKISHHKDDSDASLAACSRLCRIFPALSWLHQLLHRAPQISQQLRVLVTLSMAASSHLALLTRLAVYPHRQADSALEVANRAGLLGASKDRVVDWHVTGRIEGSDPAPALVSNTSFENRSRLNHRSPQPAGKGGHERTQVADRSG